MFAVSKGLTDEKILGIIGFLRDDWFLTDAEYDGYIN
jgi:hypothetical protein